MPIARFQMPDGRIARFEVPEGTTPEQAQSMMQAHFDSTQQPDAREKFLASLPPERRALAEQPVDFGKAGERRAIEQEMGESPVSAAYANLSSGALKGASNIGATLLSPVDKLRDVITGRQPLTANQQRRAAVSDVLAGTSDPESLAFKTGQLGAEVAGTAGIGGALAKGVRAIPVASPYLAKMATALETGGFRLGTPAATSLAGRTADIGTRMAAGGAVGGAAASMIDPEYAKTGAVLGAALPPAAMAAGKAGTAISNRTRAMAERLMQSAVKPTIQQLRSGESAVAVKTLLDNGISPNEAGVEKLQGMIDDINNQIKTTIGNSNATIDPQRVAAALSDVRTKFGNQVSPSADLASIQNVADDFMAHPVIAGGQIPVQAAQDLKQGTYRLIRKKYGQLGSAEIEAQKALARGLKEGIADKLPQVQPLNEAEQRLLDTLKVSERRALMEMNKNPAGLALLANNPAGFAAFMADKSAAFKALAARAINRSAQVPKSVGMLGQALENPALRSGLIAIEANP